MRTPRTSLPGCIELQRGRRIAAAEGQQCRRPAVQTMRFNGAAASLRRKGTSCFRPPQARASFNGAAASLRRKAITRMPLGSGLPLLQRGRRIAAAEGIKCPDCGLNQSTGFNGAAASLRRKGHARTSSIVGFMLLQRGRRIAAAEGRETRAATDPRRQASTGPPHRCGGRLVEQRRNAVVRDASTGPPHRCGGRLVVTIGAHRLGLASTGPPHRCGGRAAGPEVGQRGVALALQRGRRIAAAEGRNRHESPPSC